MLNKGTHRDFCEEVFEIQRTRKKPFEKVKAPFKQCGSMCK